MIRQDKMQDAATYRPHPMPQINTHFRADHKVEEMSVKTYGFSGICVPDRLQIFPSLVSTPPRHCKRQNIHFFRALKSKIDNPGIN